MSTRAQSGFTIIEVMLFLAITGALSVAILVGSAVVINQQRYRDSVNSIKGLIQEQYGQVANVIHSDTDVPLCSRSGDTIAFNEDEDALQHRGTSDCLIMGRFILLEPRHITVYNLIGRPDDPDAPMVGGDAAVLSHYSLSVRDLDSEQYDVSWDSRIVEPGTSKDMTTSVLIVRSPISGAMLTYIQAGNHKGSIETMVDDDNMEQKDFCVASDSISGIGKRRAVRINARASSQSAVEVPLESQGVCE